MSGASESSEWSDYEAENHLRLDKKGPVDLFCLTGNSDCNGRVLCVKVKKSVYAFYQVMPTYHNKTGKKAYWTLKAVATKWNLNVRFTVLS